MRLSHAACSLSHRACRVRKIAHSGVFIEEAVEHLLETLRSVFHVFAAIRREIEAIDAANEL